MKKTLRNTIGALALTGLVAVTSGCERERKHSPYEYDGWIGGEKVIFHESPKGGYSFENKNLLIVMKSSEKIINYVDLNGDLKLDYVLILFNKETTKYSIDNMTERVVVLEAQKQFDEYLKKIKKEKEEKIKIESETEITQRIKKGLENLK